MTDFLLERNQKMIDAIIEKANRVCPGALALIGINGSFMTGDFYEKSDLDLLILINDDRGYQLSCTFIQDDLKVGHDLYCTTWEHLQKDAQYEHPNISKLMDSKIVYCAEGKHRQKLEELRKQVWDMLSQPLGSEDYDKAEKLLVSAEHCFAKAIMAESRSEILSWAGCVIYHIENAIAMLNKKYFRFGVKRAYEELNAMDNRPEKLCELIDNIVRASSVSEIKEHLTVLVRETVTVFEDVKQKFTMQKMPVSEENITGTYEEMFSNWRNKMFLAAETDNTHLSFMSLFSANHMLSEIYEAVDIDKYDALKGYNPGNLKLTARSYADVTDAYLQEYRNAGIQEKRYADIDEFIADYRG